MPDSQRLRPDDVRLTIIGRAALPADRGERKRAEVPPRFENGKGLVGGVETVEVIRETMFLLRVG